MTTPPEYELPLVTLADVRRVLGSRSEDPMTVESAAAALDVEPRVLVREILRAFGDATGVYLRRNGRGRVVSLRGEGGQR